ANHECKDRMPISLSHFLRAFQPKRRAYRLTDQKCRADVILRRSHALDRRLARPALGSAFIWAEARGTKIANIVVLQGHTVRSRLAHGMQSVESYVRTQSPSVKEGCGT